MRNKLPPVSPRPHESCATRPRPISAVATPATAPAMGASRMVVGVVGVVRMGRGGVLGVRSVLVLSAHRLCGVGKRESRPPANGSARGRWGP